MDAPLNRRAGDAATEETLKELQAKIGQLTLEVDFLERASNKAWLPGASRSSRNTHSA